MTGVVCSCRRRSKYISVDFCVAGSYLSARRTLYATGHLLMLTVNSYDAVECCYKR